MHYAVRFKGKFHIIINKVFFSTIIFNPNACMYIDLFLKIYIYSYTWPEGPLSFAGTNRESELSAWETRNWSRVLLYLQSIEGMWILFKISESRNSTMQVLTLPVTNLPIIIVLLDFQFCWVKFLRKNYSYEYVRFKGNE